MQLTVRWHGKLADIVFEDHNTTVETSLLDRAGQRDLAEHLREIADELSPTTPTETNGH